jgi:hypothetical protein
MPKKKKKVEDLSPSEAASESPTIEQPDYSTTESEYRRFLLVKMEDTHTIRESPHDEFNGDTYLQRYVKNFKGGNSYSPPRKNPEDTSLVTGTTREKKLAVINAVINLDFETNLRPFSKDNIEDQELGQAMTDCVFQSNKEELWDEKKIYAYSELADQGDVFLMDMWTDEMRVDKKKIKLSDVNSETFKDFDPDKSMRIAFSGPKRVVLAGPQVYLGNIREPHIKNQPFIFTKQIIPYEEAKARYGNFPRFKNVPRILVQVDGGQDDRFGYNWRLGEVEKDMVEVLIYQDKFNDEFQIMLNGVMQLPVRFPMPWETGEYNIEQGSLEPISAFFAYHKSIPDKTFLDQQVIDEMLRLMVLKNQKSFAPPIANYSANILNKNMFLPGKVNNNLEKGEIEVLGGNPNSYAVQQSEFEMFKLMKGQIDEKSINPALMGDGNFGSRTTATQYEDTIKQAKQQLGIMIFGFMNLARNLDLLRLSILLENYTKERGEKVNELTGKLERKFANVNVERNIDGKGKGVRNIQFTETPDEKTDSDPYSHPLMDKELNITRDENGKPNLPLQPPAKPVRIYQIKPSVLRSIKFKWYGEVEIKERESSLADRISFEDRLMKAMQMFGIQSINMDYAKQQFAAKNKINPDLFFSQGQPSMPVPQEEIDKIQEGPVSKISRPAGNGAVSAVRQGVGA